MVSGSTVLLRFMKYFAFLVMLVPVLSGWGQSISYVVPEKKWDANLGTHRAVVRVDAAATSATAAHVKLEWRRRDPAPEKKAVVVVSAASGQRIDNVIAKDVTADSGDITFQP